MCPCPHCQRPVRHGDPACPFCAGALPTCAGDKPWKRAALGSAVIVATSAVTACPAYGVPALPESYYASPAAGATQPPSVPPGVSPAPSRAPSASPSNTGGTTP